MELTCGYCLLFLQPAAQLQMAKKKKKKSKKRSSEVLKEGISENGNLGTEGICNLSCGACTEDCLDSAPTLLTGDTAPVKHSQNIYN